jgi:hypothetical protein
VTSCDKKTDPGSQIIIIIKAFLEIIFDISIDQVNQRITIEFISYVRGPLIVENYTFFISFDVDDGQNLPPYTKMSV